MLAKIMPLTNDFNALARYLVQGKSATPHPDRVAWSYAHNLCSDDPLLVAKIMEATAYMSPRTKNAAYHTIIGWHPDEDPSAEMMQDIALKTLEMAGFGDYQALIMGHGDTPHKHLHMMINRVHPETGKAWKASHDYALFDHIMRTLSDQHGFQYTPAHRYNLDETDELAKKPNSRATYAAKRGAKTNRLQWSKDASRKFGARMGEQLDGASTFEDLQFAFAEQGLTLEEKGNGLVVGNAESYAKFSSLGLTKTAKAFGKRREPPLRRSKTCTRSLPSVFTVDGVDITRALVAVGLAERTDIGDAVQDAIAAREEVSGTSLLDRLLRDVMSQTTLSSQAAPKKSNKRSSRQRINPKQSHWSR